MKDWPEMKVAIVEGKEGGGGEVGCGGDTVRLTSAFRGSATGRWLSFYTVV